MSSDQRIMALRQPSNEIFGWEPSSRKSNCEVFGLTVQVGAWKNVFVAHIYYGYEQYRLRGRALKNI